MVCEEFHANENFEAETGKLMIWYTVTDDEYFK